MKKKLTIGGRPEGKLKKPNPSRRGRGSFMKS